MAEKKTYKVNSPIIHDGERYSVGDPIELTDKEAEGLGENVTLGETVEVGQTAATLDPTPDTQPSINNPAATPDADRRINLNTATVEELASVKYIGKAIAKKIVEGRPYDEAAKPESLTEEQWAEIAGVFTF